MWKLAEWESAVSSLPYYIWDDKKDKIQIDEMPHSEESDTGIYVVRESGPPKYWEDMLHRGYAVLPPMVELGIEIYYRPKQRIQGMTGKKYHRDRIKDVLPCPEEYSHPHLYSSDLSLISAELWKDVRFSNNRLYWTLKEREADELMRQWVLACFKGRCTRCGVYFSTGWDDYNLPVGFVGITEFEPGVEHIDLIGVHSQYRGRGIGKALVNWAVDTSNAKTIKVRTEQWNRHAVAMYKSCGFEYTGTETLYWARVER